MKRLVILLSFLLLANPCFADGFTDMFNPIKEDLANAEIYADTYDTAAKILHSTTWSPKHEGEVTVFILPLLMSTKVAQGANNNYHENVYGTDFEGLFIRVKYLTPEAQRILVNLYIKYISQCYAGGNFDNFNTVTAFTKYSQKLMYNLTDYTAKNTLNYYVVQHGRKTPAGIVSGVPTTPVQVATPRVKVAPGNSPFAAAKPKNVIAISGLDPNYKPANIIPFVKDGVVAPIYKKEQIELLSEGEQVLLSEVIPKTLHLMVQEGSPAGRKNDYTQVKRMNAFYQKQMAIDIKNLCYELEKDAYWNEKELLNDPKRVDLLLEHCLQILDNTMDRDAFAQLVVGIDRILSYCKSTKYKREQVLQDINQIFVKRF